MNPSASSFASLVQGSAALLWLPQAALLAWAIQQLGEGSGLAAVLWPAAGILLLGLLRAAAEAWGARRVYAQARTRLSDLRARVAAALAARSPLDSARPASGLAASVIAEQAEALVPYLVRYAPARWRAMVVPVVIVAVVACLSWVAAAVLLVAAPLIPIFMAIVGWRAKAASEAQMVELGGMNGFLLDRLRGLATLRSLGAVDATARRLGEAAQSLRSRTMTVLRIAFLSSAVLELFSALGVAMVAVYVGFHLLGTLGFGTWGHTLSLGEGLFILLLAPAFFEPLRELSSVWHDRAAGEAALASLERLSEDGVALPGASAADAQAVSPAAVAAAGAPAVRVRGLCFAHAGEDAFFENYELRVAAGEHVALMGPSGSGKTALLSLIAGLVPARRGEILVGGVHLTDDSVAALRTRMAWMGQKPHVFAASVQDNVALGRDGVRAAQVQAAIRFAALDGVAQARPGIALGEGGGGLSGGEAVRLALARVAAHPDADLLLVDEPTAHLDSETAERVADALMQLARGKTLIAATHDPVLAARMDRVIRLDGLPAREAA
ncbi:thiol reductant ABC exporter subunit CydD [Variovorax saccharolyticus]|uniref:thiol reductant ABC exporter subunit CydD n=1 Tax=Variovorax saccharolyticus TaxID=3053516 RepID=UPI002574B9A8|nr:thiol reductant ABC exporter subunit CydD [Variovorax sp. J31P216]MDM0022998.1 thiol reductant ABC exporter subunit CydD [Variovorax sp. J31P216]